MPEHDDLVSPPQKRINPNYAPFQQDCVADPRVGDITRCSYRIIDEGHNEYLPLHYFDPSIREQERSFQLLPKGVEHPAPRVKVTEDRMTTGMYGAWSRQHILALRLLDAPPEVRKMFARHYELVQTQVDYETAWTTWREYDLARRAQFISAPGVVKPNIASFCPVTYRKVERQAGARLREQLEAAAAVATAAAASASTSATTAAAPAAPRGQRASANAPSAPRAQGGATSKRDPFKELKYASCFLCGSRFHQVQKDGRAHKQCKPLWLSYNSKRATPAWTTPDDKAVCWAWNSPAGCSKDNCRLRDGGHCCSLCGNTAHTTHSH